MIIPHVFSYRGVKNVTKKETSCRIAPAALLTGLFFAVFYSQLPLFSKAQNTYFLHGLAKSGLGFLDRDWLANTVDPFPVFSFLAGFTFKYLSRYLFHIYYIILLSIFFIGIWGIVSRSFDFDNKSGKEKYKIGLMTLLLINLPVFNSVVYGLSGISLLNIFQYGVAGQRLTGPVFQPCNFGILIVLSIYLLLCDRPFPAVALANLAALFHSSYLPGAFVVTVLGMVALFKGERNIKKPLLLGVFSFLSILPILIYIYIMFSSSSPDIYNQARDLLINVRIPHHAKPAAWFSGLTIVKLLIIVTALVLVRKKKIFPILASFFGFSLGLSLLQVVTGWRTLALLFPWRISVILVPVSSAIVMGYIIDVVFKTFTPGRGFKKMLHAAAAVVLMGIAFLSVYGAVNSYKRFYHSEWAGMMEFVKTAKKPGDLFLIPPGVNQETDMQNFRLFTGAPVLVDYKSHPYKDGEIIEWFDRIDTAHDFYYSGRDGRALCTLLEKITADYGITHVVATAEHPLDCEIAETIYRDAHYSVYRIRNTLSSPCPG